MRAWLQEVDKNQRIHEQHLPFLLSTNYRQLYDLNSPKGKAYNQKELWSLHESIMMLCNENDFISSDALECFYPLCINPYPKWPYLSRVEFRRIEDVWIFSSITPFLPYKLTRLISFHTSICVYTKMNKSRYPSFKPLSLLFSGNR